jgi:hypothetical protein
MRYSFQKGTAIQMLLSPCKYGYSDVTKASDTTSKGTLATLTLNQGRRNLHVPVPDHTEYALSPSPSPHYYIYRFKPAQTPSRAIDDSGYAPQPEDTTDYIRPLAGRSGQQQVLRRLEYADRRHPSAPKLLSRWLCCYPDANE